MSARWKCDVCGTQVGEHVCAACVAVHVGEAKVNRGWKAHELSRLRERGAAVLHSRGDALRAELRSERLVAEERDLKETIIETARHVSSDRLNMATLAFALQHRRAQLERAARLLQAHTEKQAATNAALLHGLRWHLEECNRVLQYRRWQKLVETFALVAIEAAPPRPADTNGGAGGAARGRDADVSGVSTIMDLPLPNNGYYGPVPAEALCSALSLVARTVSLAARSLAVRLPHPLFPGASPRYATVAVDGRCRDEPSALYPLCPPHKLAEGGVVIGAAGPGGRVCHADGAFETALDLLRRDVVHLCVRAGVPVNRLWPAEALLLNLAELRHHALHELHISLPASDEPLPRPQPASSPQASAQTSLQNSASGAPSPAGPLQASAALGAAFGDDEFLLVESVEEDDDDDADSDCGPLLARMPFLVGDSWPPVATGCANAAGEELEA